jgi:hypothetical protein
VTQLFQLILTLALAGATCLMLLYQPAWMWFVAAASLAICYLAIAHLAPRSLQAALIIAALAPLSYTAYIIWLLSTIEAERSAEAPTYWALAGYYAIGAIALGLSAWLSRKSP